MSYIWDKKEDEEDKSYRAFREYLSLGPGRNLEDYSSFYSKGSNVNIEDWYKEYEWNSRANEYDEFVLRNIGNENEEATLFLQKKQRDLLESMRILADKGIKKLINSNVEELTSYDIVRLIEVSIKLEQLLQGNPTEIVDSHEDVSVDMVSISPEVANAIGKAIVQEEK